MPLAAPGLKSKFWDFIMNFYEFLMNFYEFYFTGVDELYFKSFLLAQLDLYFQEDFLYV